MGEDKKNDQLFTGAINPEVNKRDNLMTSLVQLIKHEVNIALDERFEKLDDLEKKVDGIEQDAIFNDNFSELFYEEQSNNELTTRDDIRDLVSEELDTLLEELKITRQ